MVEEAVEECLVHPLLFMVRSRNFGAGRNVLDLHCLSCLCARYPSLAPRIDFMFVGSQPCYRYEQVSPTCHYPH